MEMNLRRKTGTGWVIGLVLLLNSGHVIAQLIKVNADMDTNTIALGEQVTLSLSVEKPSGSVVEFPVFNDTLYGSVEILHKSRIDSSGTRGKVVLKQQFTLTAFDTGLFYIPPFVFIYKSDRFSDTIRSTANYLEVLSFPVDSANTIRDIKGLYKAPLRFGEIYPYLLIAAGLMIIGWFIRYYYRKRKRNEPIISRSAPVDPPDVFALKELDRLKEDKLWQQGKLKEYYSRLAEIIRSYLEGRYGIMALEQTSYEILLTMQDALGKDTNYKMLRSLLQLSDLVKFAKADPEPDENINQLEDAMQFVRNTRYQQLYETLNTGHHQQPEKVTDEM